MRPKIIAASLQQLSTDPNIESAVDCLLQGEELLPVEYSIFLFRHQAFLTTEEFAQHALRENEPRFDMLAFRFPSCDGEQSMVRARVATPEFLMNLRTPLVVFGLSTSGMFPGLVERTQRRLPFHSVWEFLQGYIHGPSRFPQYLFSVPTITSSNARPDTRSFDSACSPHVGLTSTLSRSTTGR